MTGCVSTQAPRDATTDKKIVENRRWEDYLCKLTESGSGLKQKEGCRSSLILDPLHAVGAERDCKI